MTTFKLGKAPANYDPHALTLKEFESTTVAKQAPVGYGHFKSVSDWGMLGNDKAGDCVWAGAAHETEMLTKEAGTEATFNDQCVLSDYSKVTGYNPITGANDNGTDMAVANSYRRKTGIVDANGNRHKIGAYLALEPENWSQLLEALWAFDAVGIGIQFPQSAMDQFNAGKGWSVVSGSPIEGGHYIPVVGRPTSTHLEIVTWSKTIYMTESFYKKYNDESYCFISVEDMTAGKTPEGYDLTDLNNIIKAL